MATKPNNADSSDNQQIPDVQFLRNQITSFWNELVEKDRIIAELHRQLDNERREISLNCHYNYVARCQYDLATQQLYENLIGDVLTAKYPNLVNVQPYGEDGDWKCDFNHRGAQELWQAFAPEKITEANLKAKIVKTLSDTFSSVTNKKSPGITKAWGDIKKVVFAFRTEHLPPKILEFLRTEAVRLEVEIGVYLTPNFMDDVSHLTITQKMRIFGPPPTWLS